MSQHKHTIQNRENKRSEFSGNEQTRNNSSTTKLVVVIVALAAVIIGYMVIGRTNGESKDWTKQATAESNAVSRLSADSSGEVSIPIAELTGKANFYDYTTENGREVRLFAMKSSDGVYRVALDACDVCFAAKKGYYQDGDDMVCRKCGNRFPSSEINDVHGGCNPMGLSRKVEGNRLVLKASELANGSRYF